jgi:CTP:molybdopterin cytidylyltransferase MocA
MRVAAAILAAGASRRLGQPKQLLPFRGTTLLRAMIGELAASSCDRVAVVLGAHASEVAATLLDLELTRLVNPAWREGMASSIRCAAGWAMATRSEALLIATCDQPRLTTAHVDRLIAAFAEGAHATGSRYSGVVGVPAIFGAPDFLALGALDGDLGARSLLGVDAVDWPDGALDLDTAADVARVAIR